MAAKGIQSNDPVPQHPKVKTSKAHSIRSGSQSQSASSSSATKPECSAKLEWHVCPKCKSIRAKGDEKSSASTSPTTSDLSQSRSISFARLGLRIKKDLYGVFGRSQETPSSTPEKAKVSKSKKKKKPQKKVYVYDKGYQDIGGDHWADEY